MGTQQDSSYEKVCFPTIVRAYPASGWSLQTSRLMLTQGPKKVKVYRATELVIIIQRVSNFYRQIPNLLHTSPHYIVQA